MKPTNNRIGSRPAARPAEFAFDVWVNDQADFPADESGSFDDNWIVSAGDLFGKMDLLIGLSDRHEPISYYDEAS